MSTVGGINKWKDRNCRALPRFDSQIKNFDITFSEEVGLMKKVPGPPSFDGLKRRIARHRAENPPSKKDHFV
ncbi:hypothetical protein ACC685_36755, partial [Rhizobium ruizarguesonis]